MPTPTKVAASQHAAQKPPLSQRAQPHAVPVVTSRNIIRRAQTNPGSLTSGEWLQLQRQIGNRAVSRLAAPGRANGLPPRLATAIQSLSGYSLEHVNVHYNSGQPARLNALAFARGRDIHVAPGQEEHLPHEAWHVVQQAQGRVQTTLQRQAGVPVNDDAGLEHEADVMGQKAVQLASAWRASPAPAPTHVLELQRTVGNASVATLLSSGPAQLRRDLSEDEYAGLDVAIKNNGAKPSYAESRGYYNTAAAKGAGYLNQANGVAPTALPQRTVAWTRWGLWKRGYKHSATLHPETGAVALASRRGGTMPADAPYRNTYQSAGGIFEAEHNKGNEDADPRLKLKSGKAANSDIIFEQYRRAAVALGIELRGNLREIHRKGIMNPETNHVMLWADGGESANIGKEQQVTDPEDRAALIGTDNGKSSAFIVLNHGHDLGVNGIGDIFFTRLADREGEMRIVLRSADEPATALE